MLPFIFRLRSANESAGTPSEEADALLSGSTEDAPPSPEQEPGSPEQAVPYSRFKEVNDKYAQTKQQLEELRAMETAAAETPAVPADAIATAVAEALKSTGLSEAAQEIKAFRAERYRERTMGELQKIPGFNEQRDLPRIVETMKAKNIGALDAFKLIQFDAPPQQAPVLHDAVGQSAAGVEASTPQQAAFDRVTSTNIATGIDRTPQAARDAIAKERMMQVLNTPKMKKALEL